MLTFEAETKKREIILSNTFATARWDMGVNEMRLFFLFLTKISDSNTRAEISAWEFASEWGIPLENAYVEFKRTARTLLTRKIELETDKGWMGFTILRKASAERYTGRFELALNDDIKGLFTQQKSNFFKVLLSNLRMFNTFPGVRIYLLAKSAYPCETVEHDVRKFQMIVGRSSKRRCDLVRRIINPEIEKISKTDLSVQLVRSRPTAIRFKISRNDYASRLVNDFGFKRNEAYELLRKIRHRTDYDKYVEDCLCYCKDNLDKHVIKHNVKAYVTQFILNDYRPVNPKNLREKIKHEKQKDDDEKKKADDEKRKLEAEAIERRHEDFRKNADKECLHRILKSVAENESEFNPIFREMVRGELKKNPSDISELPYWLSDTVLSKWEDGNSANFADAE
ncbi:MAG: replication initiation protein [Victivallales bacterium]